MMSRKAGWLSTALYLKCCAVALMRVRAGSFDKHMPLPHPISLTRGGLPRVIPAFHRRLIRMGGDRGDRLVRFYLSVFSLGKLVVVAKRNDYQYASIVESFSKE